MSHEDWLYRKVDQSAHNEILAFLLMVLGMNLLMGGLIMTMSLVGELNIIPLFGEKPLTASTTLSLILSITGFSVTLAGFVLVIYYDRKRTWYTGQMDKSTLRNKKKTERKTIEELLRE